MALWLVSASSTAQCWPQLFSATADVIFLVLLPSHLRPLYRTSSKIHRSWRGSVKALACVLYAVLQLVVLIWQLTRDNPSSYNIAESSLSFSASLGLIWLSSWAHRRSLHPSNLTIAYLLARLVCYLLWIPVHESSADSTVKFSLGAQVFSTFFLLLLEAQGKEAILLKAYANQPPEATTSFLGNVLFVWINPIIAKGYNRLLHEDDIPVLDSQTSSRNLRQLICRAWDQRVTPENGATLPRVLVGGLLSPFLAPVLPRILVVVFSFTQPLLISRAIRFVTQPSGQDDNHRGYWIVVSATAIYIGIAISSSAYAHRQNRLKVMLRGTLIGLLHSHTLQARGNDEDDGKVVSLMSNDISNIENSGETLHETWGQFLEVVVGMILLAREVGWLWPLPLMLILLCSRMSKYVAKNMKTEQGKWNTATQKRISVINSMLGSIKNIKMLGMQQYVANHVEDLRYREIDAAGGVRRLILKYNFSANALGMFAPVFTIILYAVLARLRGESMDVETAFTSIAILAMITHPANMVMTMVPRAVVSYSSFERVQAYLLNEPRSDPPLRAEDSRRYEITRTQDSIAIGLDNVTITGSTTSKPILQNISLNIPQGSVMILTGPVGSGKTILTRAILGEMEPSQGKIRVSSSNIAYCSQSPWLPNQTIKEVICGPGFNEEYDETWYYKSIKACCLDSDIQMLPEGDLTVVGSKGMNLSGGQRQRVALARAVYSRCDIVVLDDSFSALDGKTQNQTIEYLLGREGILRKLGVTVIWISTTTRYFHLADDIVVLAGGVIKESGTWDQLRRDDPLIDDIIHAHQGASKEALGAPKLDRNRLGRKVVANGEAEDTTRKSGDLSLYSYYFRSAGFDNVTLMILICSFYGFFITIPSYWLKWWTESPTSLSHTGFYITGYLILLIMAYILTLSGIYFALLRVAPTSGITLHHRLLVTVIQAPLIYFSEIDTGTILNRFSQDIQLVDKQLPDTFLSLTVQIFKLFMQACLLFASQPLVTLSLPFSATVVYMVQRAYLRTSRQLRLLELESRSAVFSSFLETVQGAATIRAFGWQREIAQENITTLENSQRPFYLLLCLQQWLNVVLDLLIAGIAVGTISLAVHFKGSTTGGQVGVALNIILVANSTLLKLVRSWTNMEISLGAVARLKGVETNTLAEEQEGERLLPPETWPSAGAIEFENVKAAYNPSATALQDLDLAIKPGQTVVVCGRTGSGKSSLLLSLLRLLDVTEGTITIDGVDISQLSKSLVRQRAFITVAQEAFFLPQASLRFNLDPELKADPSVIIATLKRTGLWEHFSAHYLPESDTCRDRETEHTALLSQGDGGTDEGRAILETFLVSLPVLSAGQTQILALTRALVTKQVLSYPTKSHPANILHYPAYTDFLGAKPIVLLDEVTSSLDPVTEANIYDIIQKEFIEQGHTVVMVTHKLQGIKGRLREGRDVVIWMAEGRVERVEQIGG